MLVFESPPEQLQFLLHAGTPLTGLVAAYVSTSSTGNLTVTAQSPLPDGRIPITLTGFPTNLPNGRYTISLTTQAGACCYASELVIFCPPVTTRPTHLPTDTPHPACCP